MRIYVNIYVEANMTVETTVQEMFDKYPLMYSTREECFDHLFCTIGNGYEWKWGQLVYHDRGNPDYDEEAEKELNEKDYESEHLRAVQSESNLEKKRQHDKLWERAGIMKPGGKHDWYPLSRKYSRLFTIPDDARDDWKSAVEECKKMLEEDGIDWQSAE